MLNFTGLSKLVKEGKANPGALKTPINSGRPLNPWTPIRTPVEYDLMNRDTTFAIQDRTLRQHYATIVAASAGKDNTFTDMLLKEELSQAEIDFFADFVFWLRGMPKEDRDRENTPWLKGKTAEKWNPHTDIIPGRDVKIFLEMINDARIRFMQELAKLKTRYPKDLMSAYLYFKYIVRAPTNEHRTNEQEIAEDWFKDLAFMLDKDKTINVEKPIEPDTTSSAVDYKNKVKESIFTGSSLDPSKPHYNKSTETEAISGAMADMMIKIKKIEDEIAHTKEEDVETKKSKEKEKDELKARLDKAIKKLPREKDRDTFRKNVELNIKEPLKTAEPSVPTATTIKPPETTTTVEPQAPIHTTVKPPESAVATTTTTTELQPASSATTAVQPSSTEPISTAETSVTSNDILKGTTVEKEKLNLPQDAAIQAIRINIAKVQQKKQKLSNVSDEEKRKKLTESIEKHINEIGLLLNPSTPKKVVFKKEDYKSLQKNVAEIIKK